jgi:hypothetical protein
MIEYKYMAPSSGTQLLPLALFILAFRDNSILIVISLCISVLWPTVRSWLPRVGTELEVAAQPLKE